MSKKSSYKFFTTYFTYSLYILIIIILISKVYMSIIYLLNSFIIISDNKNTAIKFGTAKNKVTASDKFIIDLKFIAEPAIMHKQYIA